MSADTAKAEALHRLIDQLPPSELHAARRYLEFLVRAVAEDSVQVTEEAPVARVGVGQAAFLEFRRGPRRFGYREADPSDPVQVALAGAPGDDEPSTPEEDKAAEDAWQAYLRGESVSDDELRREIGW